MPVYGFARIHSRPITFPFLFVLFLHFRLLCLLARLSFSCFFLVFHFQFHSDASLTDWTILARWNLISSIWISPSCFHFVRFFVEFIFKRSNRSPTAPVHVFFFITTTDERSGGMDWILSMAFVRSFIGFVEYAMVCVSVCACWVLTCRYRWRRACEFISTNFVLRKNFINLIIKRSALTATSDKI